MLMLKNILNKLKKMNKKKLPIFMKLLLLLFLTLKIWNTLMRKNKTTLTLNFNKFLKNSSLKEPKKPPERETWKTKPEELKNKPKDSKKKENASKECSEKENTKNKIKNNLKSNKLNSTNKNLSSKKPPNK